MQAARWGGSHPETALFPLAQGSFRRPLRIYFLCSQCREASALLYQDNVASLWGQQSETIQVGIDEHSSEEDKPLVKITFPNSISNSIQLCLWGWWQAERIGGSDGTMMIRFFKTVALIKTFLLNSHPSREITKGCPSALCICECQEGAPSTGVPDTVEPWTAVSAQETHSKYRAQVGAQEGEPLGRCALHRIALDKFSLHRWALLNQYTTHSWAPGRWTLEKVYHAQAALRRYTLHRSADLRITWRVRIDSATGLS